MFTRLADLATAHPRRMIAGAIVIAIVAGVLGSGVASRLSSYGANDPATDSFKTSQAIESSTGVQASPGVVLLVRDQARAKVEHLAGVLRHDRDVARVSSYYDSHARAMLSNDGRSTYIAAWLRKGVDDATLVKRLKHELAGQQGVLLGGQAPASRAANEIVQHDLGRAELLAFPILFLLSLWFFRSLVASLLPPLVGGLAIVLAFLGIRIVSEWMNLSVVALNLITGLGLGLAIDYSLFLVSRYREEIARHGATPVALRATLATAGRTALFSSLTVAAAMAALLVFPQKFLRSMGVGGVLVALIAATVTLVVLPSILALLGTRVNALAPKWLQRAADSDARPASSGFWYRLSRFVMRRPARVAVSSAALLIALGLPFLGAKFIAIDATALPTSQPPRQVDTALRTEFPPNPSSSIVVAASTPAGPKAQAFADRVRSVPGVAAVTAPRPISRGLTEIDVISKSGEQSGQSQRIVKDVRALPAAFHVGVTGGTASLVDLKASLAHHLPIALALVASTTAIVLFLMTGSVVLPIKGLLMNLLSVSAAFGLLVLIFQDGRFQGLLGYTGQGALEATQPVLLAAIAFGLSTDYGVFLLARIKEARDAGASDREAVAMGLERTGRIVSAAAVLFCVAIGAFATSQMIFIKELGVGTGLAVLIDASIVRALLVPSLMELLGRWNWWAPRPLRRLHQRFGLAEPVPV